MDPVRVMIIEDSKLMQKILFEILSSDPGVNVVATVSDPFAARKLIKKINPDVLTLDIMLPYMDGITFLKNLMRLHPLPVVMVSSLTEEGSAIALEALSIGAVDYLAKPSQKELADLSNYARELIAAVKNAAKAKVSKQIMPVLSDKKFEKVIYQTDLLKKEVIAIGASTGGIEAIESILIKLPKVLPPIIVTQHIKREFSTAFSKRIRKLYGLTVMEAENYSEILPGNIYIAPSDTHLVVKKRHDRYFTRLQETAPVNGHRPSIDVLFHSIAEIVGANSIGVLLTGMGTDGAEGLKAIHDAGGTTIVQDEGSSVVWGMPGAAVKIHAADYVVSLDLIPEKILQVIDSKSAK